MRAGEGGVLEPTQSRIKTTSLTIEPGGTGHMFYKHGRAGHVPLNGLQNLDPGFQWKTGPRV